MNLKKCEWNEGENDQSSVKAWLLEKEDNQGRFIEQLAEMVNKFIEKK
ncbi:hypothetical protein LGQ02_20990 [Bacillus shivajii]|nr:hypothetical protein [Bacillus shivajii]UCZ53215.1 hypothetical protein LGQ02_20990 [Bacillus shivajii]